VDKIYTCFHEDFVIVIEENEDARRHATELGLTTRDTCPRPLAIVKGVAERGSRTRCGGGGGSLDPKSEILTPGKMA